MVYKLDNNCVSRTNNLIFTTQKLVVLITEIYKMYDFGHLTEHSIYYYL